MADKLVNNWWISEFPQRFLSTAEQREHNYWNLALSLKEAGWTDHAVSGVLGNIEWESGCNPACWEYCATEEHQNYYGDCGYHLPGAYLFAWTPWTKYFDWAVERGKEEYDACSQLEFLFETLHLYWNLYDAYGLGGDYFPTWQDFAKSSEYSIDKYALAWCSYYEKPAEDPALSHVAERIESANYWYKRITTESPPTNSTACSGSGCVYMPRLTDAGIAGSNFWYSDNNPFFASGFGLPNCTCYAWGRWWELFEQNGFNELPKLPTSDGGQWFSDNTEYTESSSPSLGAVACFEDLNGGAGHVAIVEEISDNDMIRLSNSAYGGDLFLMSEMNVKDGIMWGHFKLQGFIVNPHACKPSKRPQTRRKKRKLLYYLKKRRLRK